jgi:hypothetical protein
VRARVKPILANFAGWLAAAPTQATAQPVRRGRQGGGDAKQTARRRRRLVISVALNELDKLSRLD